MTSRAPTAPQVFSRARFQSDWWFSATAITRHDSENCPKIKELSFGLPSAMIPAVKAMLSMWGGLPARSRLPGGSAVAVFLTLSAALLGQAPAPVPDTSGAATENDADTP